MFARARERARAEHAYACLSSAVHTRQHNMYQLAASVLTDPARSTCRTRLSGLRMDGSSASCGANRSRCSPQHAPATELQRVGCADVSDTAGQHIACVCVCPSCGGLTSVCRSSADVPLVPSSSIDTFLPPLMRAQCAAAATARVSCLWSQRVCVCVCVYAALMCMPCSSVCVCLLTHTIRFGHRVCAQ